MRFLASGILAVMVLLAAEVYMAPGEVMESPPVTMTPAWGDEAHVAFAGHVGSESAYYRAMVREWSPAESLAPSIQVDDEALTAVIRRVCVVCHNDRMSTGNLSLQNFNVSEAAGHQEETEKIITKLRLDMMPPPGMPRPGTDTLVALVQTLEERMDEAVAANPNPGARLPQRLNQAEYRRSVRDLLGVEFDPSAFLPPETISDNFDNIADVQTISPALLDGYMRAAGHVSRAAIGNPDASPVQITYRVPQTTNQRDRVEGAPYGSRGGISVVHNFLADGEYSFRLELHAETEGNLFGRHARGEQIELSLNGERLALLPIDRWMWERDPEGLTITTEQYSIPAGPHRISAVFVPTSEGPINDLMEPIEHTLADLWITRDVGITTIPHLRDLRIDGPFGVTGVSSTPSRARVFSCYPTSAEDAEPCAQSIVDRLGSQAFRRDLTPDEVAGIMGLYRQAAEEGGFEDGVRVAIQAMLASPHFVLRFDLQPEGVAPGDIFPLSSHSMASRLSYFLWATQPDEELLTLAEEDRLQDPDVLRAQVDRMLDDPRSETLATRFAAQWLRLPRLDVHRPDAVRYPEWDDRLRDAVRRETELFFHNLIQDDASLRELLTADHTFVNERLARHYGLSGVIGSDFRRVDMTDPRRAGIGILGHASILALSSHANRTSPVDRGLWVMETLMGSEPPPPPPNVPLLDETEAVDGESGRTLTVRERLEMHRRSPTCNSCHQFIDPLGLPLENWDPVGLWRTRDGGTPLDTRGELWTGRPVETTQDLRDVVLSMEIQFVRNFTENLMRYGLGRRVHYYDMPAIRQIASDAGENDYRMRSFILGVVLSDQFRMRVAEQMADASSAQ